MRFLRTTSTGRLLTAIAAVLVIAAGGSAIAVAATSGGPVARPSSLAGAVHRALAGPSIQGVTADVTFTDNLIDSSDFAGGAVDPLLQGASGRLWLGDGRLRIELQSGNGDAQIVVDHRSYWISDPAQNVVYRGTLPAPAHDGSDHDSSGGVPSVARIQSVITRLMTDAGISGAKPTDVAGRPAYGVSITPKGNGGLVGSARLAFDALNGAPLSLGVYARGATTPVLSLTAAHISYGPVAASAFDVTPPAGAKVMTLGGPATPSSAHPSSAGHAPTVTGVHRVAARVPFTLAAPATAGGRSLSGARLLGTRTALLRYGSGLGGLTVIETPASAGGTVPSGGSVDGLSLPSRTIDGATGTELSTPLGSVLTIEHGGIRFTILGSVDGPTAVTAAQDLLAG